MGKKQTTFILAMLLFFSLHTFAQVRGTVTDKDTHSPIEFANVILLSHDSTMIDGAVTDSTGHFIIQKTTSEAQTLRISSLGYKVQNITIGNSTEYQIALEADPKQLSEVTVKARKYIHSPEGLIANIANSPLSRLDNVQDVLKHIPFISVKDNDYTVIGKGTPLIYINNRLIYDNEELQRLKASDIKQVKVILHPGAEYSSTVNAVIRIITNRTQGEGLSGSVNGNFKVERKWNHNGDLSLNYHTGAVDIFASSSYGRNDLYYDQSTALLLPARQVNDRTTMHFLQTRFNEKLGFNYLNNKVSFGAYYNYSLVPNGHYTIPSSEDVYDNTTLIDRTTSMDVRGSNRKVHTANAYFNYDFSEKTSLKFDFDIVNSIKQNDENYTQNHQFIAFTNKARSRLYAAKTTLSTSLLGGIFKTGGELSFTNNRNVYTLLPETNIPTSLTNNKNQIKQWLAAGFLSYERNLGDKWSGSIGLRYEFDKADYFINEQRQPAQSHVANTVSPMASIAYEDDNIEMALSYKYYTLRPTYFDLRSSTAFNTPYSYEGGNPALESTHTNVISYSLAWDAFNFTADYAINRNLTQNVLSFYNSNDTIALFHPVNVKRSQSMTLSLDYAPKLFDCWTPDFNVTYYKPYITYNQDRFRHAQWSLDWDNTLELPHDWILGLEAYWTSRGYNTSGVYDTHPAFGMNSYANKSFLKGKLLVRLEATNLLNTDEDKWRLSTNGLGLEKWDNMNRRTIILSVSYRFNQNRTKYKGSNASNEINRL